MKDQNQAASENTIATMDTAARNALAIGNEVGQIMITMDMTQPNAADKLFNALNADAGKISSLIGKTIKIKDVYAENVEGINEETGEYETYTMLVLFDVEGNAWRCSSTGMKNALRRAFAMFGSPTWPDGLEFEIVQVETPKGRTFTLKRVW